MRLDVMVDMKGLEGFNFHECLQMASYAEIDSIHVPVIHINHLIANKQAVNRPKDQLDVIYLEKIKRLRDEEGYRKQTVTIATKFPILTSPVLFH